MKSRKKSTILFIPLLIFFVALLGWIVFPLNSGSSAEPTEKAARETRKDRPVVDSALPEETPLEIADVVPEPVVEKPEEPQPEEAFVKRVISSGWIDAPGKLAGRQRVRIVEADFKYPFLRLEEAVTTDPETGGESVVLLRSSVADHLMVGIAAGGDEHATRKILEDNGYRVRAVEPDSYILAELADFTDPLAQSRAIGELKALDEFIDFAEPDYIVHPCLAPNDPAYSSGKMWGLHNPGTTAGSKRDADIDAPEAWALRTGAPDIVVAVTDTGVQYNHEDLNANMWRHPTTGSHGFDAYDDDDDPLDIGGHGTHCAGTIGAVGNNGMGMTGVAWEVQLMAVRFLGPNGGATSDAIRSVNYSRLNGAHIISASWGGGGYSQGLYHAIQACQQAGIPFVAAAGNSSTNNDSTPHYPSSYNLPNIVAVASTTIGDTMSPFSCYGRYSVDIGAPGSSIWSTYVGGNTSYKYLNGTSMAAPHVSGALALAMAHFPGENSAKLIARLYESADRIPALNRKVSSNGRLNLHGLLTGATAPKSNDNFADAFRFEGSYGFWSGTSQDATKEPDEDSFSVPGSGIRSLWFAFRTTHDGLVKLDAYSNLAGYRIIVFEGSEKGELKVIHDVPNGASALQTIVSFNAKPDTEYRVMLDDRQPDGQMYALKYTLSPPNDFFSAATVVTGDSFLAEGTNRGATQEVFEQTRPHAGIGKGNSVWWRWTAPEDMDFTINTMGSDFDTVLAAYTGANASNLTEIASNDDRNSLDWTSQVGFQAIAGTTYHIAVDGYRDDASGEIRLNGFRSGQLTILRQPQSLEVEIGKRAVFDVSVLSGGEPLFQWFFNNEAIPGQTSANLVIDPVRADQFGGYQVEVRNSENLVVSETAVLSQRQTPPVLVWSSGNQAVASGTGVSLAATFSGSEPMSYTWTKNGQPHPGETASLSLASAQVADAGAYRLTATNSTGSATADFTLSVVQSPWDRWEWRRPGIPNAAITDIKVYDGEAFAVSGTNLHRSTDGVNWTKSVFPEGFYANSFAKAGSLLLCNGLNNSGQFRVAISTDNGTSWTISATTGHPTTFQPEKFSLIGFGDAFIAYNTVSNTNGKDFFRSVNGLTWTRLNATTLTGASIDLQGKGSIASDGSKLILASHLQTFNSRLRYFESSDGITWVEHDTANHIANYSTRPETAYFDGQKFYLFGSQSIHSSADGTSWSLHEARSNGYAFNSLFATNGASVISFTSGTQTMRYFSHPEDLRSRIIQPPLSGAFTAASTFGSKVLYGTAKGNVGLATDETGVSLPSVATGNLDSVEFMDGLFIARSPKGISSTVTIPDMVSGDGITWKPSTLLGSANVAFSGGTRGKHYGTVSFPTGLYAGHNPFDVRLAPDDDIGLLPDVSFVGELPNGHALAISYSAISGNHALHARDVHSESWSQVSFPLTVSKSTRFASLGNRWFSNLFSSSTATALIHTSTDGSAWTSTGITGANPVFATFGGKSWCIYQSSSPSSPTMVASSADGTTWTNVAATGLPMSAGKFRRRLFAFDSYLVLLGADQHLYFSEDGASWFRGQTPGKVLDLATGNGQLVAVLIDGGLIQTGAVHGGINAPQITIESPHTLASHLIGSQIMIEGAVSDNEDGIAAYEAWLDDEIVASGTGNSFRFKVATSDLRGHTVTVRTTDSHGLRQIDAIRLNVVAPEPVNLLANPEGKTYVPHEHAISFDGIFHVASNRFIYRSPDGRSWQRVPIPAFEDSIHGMASGNGALVIQFKNGGIIGTRDGINWTHFLPSLTINAVREPVRFSMGMFITSYRGNSSIGVAGSVMTSQDGLRWEAGSPSVEGYVSWSAHDGAGTMIGASSKGVHRTMDYGYNWLPVEGLGTPSGGDSYGFFGNGKFVVLLSDRNKLFTSTDSYHWTEHVVPASVSKDAILVQVGGRFFLGSWPDLSLVSEDASDWQPISHQINPQHITHARGLFVALASGGGLITSPDGVTWTPVANQGMPDTFTKLVSNENTHLAIDSRGGLWSSSDGVGWQQLLPGGAPTGDSILAGSSIAQLDGKLVIAGSRTLVMSADDGESWANVTVNGMPPSESMTYFKVVAGNSSLLVLEGSFSGAKNLLRSTDGIAFTTVSDLPAKTWADLSSNGHECMLLATDGTLLRSLDGGLTWTQIPTTNMPLGTALAWFDGRWIIIGSDAVGSSATYMSYSLSHEGILENHGNIGFLSIYKNQIRTLVAHGKLMIWQRGTLAFVSSDGRSWTRTNFQGAGGNADFEIHSTSDGFTGFSFSLSTVRTWKAGTDGVSWMEVPSEFNNIQFSDNLGERVFLFGPDIISELHDKDLALTLPALSDVTLGVGEEVSADVTIRNLARAIPPGGSWRVTAWLAKNRFYGDTKNIPLGTFDITDAMPAPGASADYRVSFTLPNEILTGDNYLILSLSGPDGVVETNTANNTVISDTAFITIPEWEFSVATNGNGQVNRDFAAMRYPHNAQVSLTATAGKGAVFTGWGGDANSPNDQVTILMDGDKTLQANFSNRANLQVFVRGLGQVGGRADLGSYAVNETAQLTAAPAEGWSFSHWSGAIGETDPGASILMDRPKTVTAHFVQTSEAWKALHFDADELLDPKISGDDSDPDADGVPNWQEYLHGSDPNDKESTGIVSVALDDEFLRCVYTRHTGAANGASITCQAGRGMNDWSDPQLEERIISSEDGLETIEARFPRADHERGFIRFRYVPETP